MTSETTAKSFTASLEQLRDELRFVADALRLRPRLGAAVNWNQTPDPLKKEISSFMARKNATGQSFNRGLVVTISGLFEEFMRKSVRDAITAQTKLHKQYDNIPEKIRNRNFIQSGKVLAIVGSMPDHVHFDHVMISRRLGACVERNLPELNAEAFAFGLTNIDADELLKTLEKCGLNATWDSIADADAFRKLFQTNKRRDCATGAAAFMDNFSKLRNRIAHTGSESTTVTDAESEFQIDFFLALAARIRALLT